MSCSSLSHILRYVTHVLRERISEVGVIDKAVYLLDVLVKADGPTSLAQLSAASGIHRATAHRLLKSLQVHGFVRIDEQSRWSLGARLAAIGERAAQGLPLQEVAREALATLRNVTEESVQLFVRDADRRVCVASLESPHGLRTIVGLGETLPLDRGSAGKVLLADEVSMRRGWAESIGERQAGVASVSAPIIDREGRVRAAVSVSGPIERTTRSPGKRYGDAVMAAARSIEAIAGW
jgi:DNA-binding IclR family transcriptional regulator